MNRRAFLAALWALCCVRRREPPRPADVLSEANAPFFDLTKPDAVWIVTYDPTSRAAIDTVRHELNRAATLARPVALRRGHA